MKNVPAAISESFARLRFSFPVAGFFGGRLRPDKGTQVPGNSLYIGKNRGVTEQLFESKKKRTMDSFLVVLQKLLNCSSQFSQSTKQGNPCPRFSFPFLWLDTFVAAR